VSEVAIKKVLLMSVCFVMIFSTVGCSKVKKSYEQEYIAGQENIQGNVDIDDFYERDKRFEIGATKDGVAVFKNPEKAYEALIENYSDGLTLIKDEMKLDSISKNNYQEYKTYGWQVTTGSKDEQEQAHFVSSFFDIYENSFE